MSELQLIKELEKKYNIEDVVTSDLKVWSFLRYYYFSEILKTGSYYRFKKGKELEQFLQKIKKSFQVLYGIDNMISVRNCRYLLFTDSLEKRIFNGKFIDKIAEGLFEVLGYENFIVIENPTSEGHIPINKLKQKKVISLYLFLLLAKLRKTPKIEVLNEDILKELGNNLNVSIDYKKMIGKFFKLAKLWYDLIIKMRPEIVFINCYYNIYHQSLIYACKKLKIPVVELQHGVINSEHYAYNINKDLGNLTFPDYLFVFGEYFKTFFKGQNYFISQEKVFPVGYYYLDLMKNYSLEEKYKKFADIWKQDFKKVILISGQESSKFSKDILEFYIECAKRDKRNIYIYRPRLLNVKLPNISMDNFIIIRERDFDIYRLLKIADIHTTHYSTTCFESLSFSVPNIMVNINNMSKLHFGSILDENFNTYYVDTVDGFIDVVKKIKKSDFLCEKASYFFANNHTKLLESAINRILEETKGVGL